MKKTMISRLISRLKHIKSPLNLRRKLLTSVRRGLNSTVIRSLKPLYWRDPSSSFSYRSFGSSVTRVYVPLQPTSPETSKPTSLPTHLYAKRLVLNLTRPSTILDALRSRGAFSPSRGRVITSISPATSGLQVQILCTHEEKPRV